MPSISMNPADRYVTQASAYDRLLVGRPLTDRIISRRQKQGFFGNGLVNPKLEAKKTRKKLISILLEDFSL